MLISADTEHKKNAFAAFLCAAVAFSVGFTLFFAGLSIMSNHSMWSLLVELKNNLYFPHYNNIVAGQIAHIPTMQVLAFIVFGAVVLALIGHFFYTRSASARFDMDPKRIISAVGIVSLLAFAGIQQIKRHEIFEREWQLLGHKTLAEKNLMLWGPIYAFAETCQKSLSASYEGKVLTDSDLTRDPYMFHYNLLSYHLYPKVSLRYKKKGIPEALIVISSNGAAEALPKGYRILVTSKDNQCLLAVKEGAAK